MPSTLNILAAFWCFLAASALVYGLWQPVIDVISYFPTPLYEFTAGVWIGVCFMSALAVFQMMVGDDQHTVTVG